MPRVFVHYTRDLLDHGTKACELAEKYGWDVVNGPETLDDNWRRKQAEKCDAFVVLCAFYYGESEGPHSVESEWQAARERKTPTRALLLDDNASWPVNKVQKTSALTSFRDKLRSAGGVETFQTSQLQ